MTGDAKLAWWRTGVIYQIYPRSFQDSNGDGVGDLAGIIERVDYLAWLGLDAVWISPFYPSPMADFGYDISNYTDVDPLFGTLADFDRLLAALHQRQIRVILDFVPNHTSIEHPWFQESRKSRSNPKRDWYIWHDPAPDGGPPNNWLSQAGGGAWTFEPETRQYYYHAFLALQPDLNWRNPEVRAAMKDVLRFWLDRGVDGFRVDVLWHLAKDPDFRDDPLNPNYRDSEPPFMRVLPKFSADHADMIAIATEMRQVLDEYKGDRVLIGELSLPLARLMDYYGPELSAVHLPFNFALLWTAWTREGWSIERLAHMVERYEKALPPGAWPNWVIGNHDQPRVATRIGMAQARVAMVLLLTLRGTPTLYYGDELGHPSVEIPPERVRDPFGINMPGGTQGRDPVRTPMPWDNSVNAGFTTGEPWLPLAPNAAQLDVVTQKADPNSMLSLTHRLLGLRRQEPALHQGDWKRLAVGGEAFAYLRSWEGRSFAVLLEINSRNSLITLPEGFQGRIVLSTQPSREQTKINGDFNIQSDEAVIVEVLSGSSLSS
ncbi:MAG: alpha-amylase family glycosyl hydrolase [Hyphomicrobiales bacterium]